MYMDEKRDIFLEIVKKSLSFEKGLMKNKLWLRSVFLSMFDNSNMFEKRMSHV